MSRLRVVVIGAGIAGLCAALDLALAGVEVTVLERAAVPGGKLREVEVAGQRIDAGPTVLTLRWVFDDLLMAAGQTLQQHLSLRPAQILARHAWSATQRLDLCTDHHSNCEAIGKFAGAAEARRYRAFITEAARVYRALERPFMRASRPSPLELVQRAGLRGLRDLLHIDPFHTLWHSLGKYFRDERLRQLFGRYATYCGSSPFEAPATLMLIAHAEQHGVWVVEGGMYRLAALIARLARERGVRFRYHTEAKEVLLTRGKVSRVKVSGGELVDADAVIVNADASAVAAGILGNQAARAVRPTLRLDRSMSALTWAMVADVEGFPLVRHNVFFSGDYAREFQQILHEKRLPTAPTVYVCAQDRPAAQDNPSCASERLLCLVNAPPAGDRQHPDGTEIESCERTTFQFLESCGLILRRHPERTVVTSPIEFARLFPATGGALYGPATHGWRASFDRPRARTRISGLYLAGGSVHPGPGLPMAALSGRLAAACLLQDLTSAHRRGQVVIPGGTSTD